MSEKPVFSDRITSPKARLAFPHLETPNMKGKFPSKKFEATFLFSKEDVKLDELKSICIAAAKEKWGEDVDLTKLRFPFRDGDEKKELAGFSGTVFIRAKSSQKPSCYDKATNDALPSDFYAGCYVRGSLTAMTYDGDTSGVTFLLNGVQFMEDGDRFGRADIRSDFASVDDTENSSATQGELGMLNI